jgi:hypothetical protein
MNHRQVYYQINSKLTIRKRLKTAVLKKPYITLADNQDDYYYQLLILFFPFRDESKLLDDHKTIKDACIYLLNKQDELQKAIERIEFLDPEISLETSLSDEQISVIEDEFIEIIENNNEGDRVPISQDDLRNRINQLNFEQKSILNKIRRNLASPESNQAFEIIHGPGGVGKSFLAKILIDAINLSYDFDITNLKRHVLVAAPTIVAAKAIAGRTLHNAFSLPIEKFGLGQYQPIKGINHYLIKGNLSLLIFSLIGKNLETKR